MTLAADICLTNLAEIRATLAFTHCEWSRRMYRSAFATVAMVVKFSLYDREAEWFAGIPDELVLMDPSYARVSENGAAVGLSGKLQTHVVALEADKLRRDSRYCALLYEYSH